jgi:hypothetical protein
MKPRHIKPRHIKTKPLTAGASRDLVRRRARRLYETEKIEAYNVAIEALRGHEPADGDPTGIAWKLRRALADKLDREIQKWCDANPRTQE